MQDLFNSEDNVCISGGAKGADAAFGIAASRAGDGVIHMIFQGHHSRCPGDQLLSLTTEQLAVADEHLEKANLTLKRRWPVAHPFVANLLRRNYYQVVWSQSLYAISKFDRYGMVSGGTAWAVQMMIDINSLGNIFVFDQEEGQWYQWKSTRWMPVLPPARPQGIYAGVGSRELNSAGEAAILALYG